MTWEPYGSQGVKSGGKVLLSSKDTPGAIVDVLGARNDVLKTRPDEVRRVIATWFDALQYVEQHRDESFKITAKASGVSVAEFAEMWQGVRIFTLANNKAALEPDTAAGNFRATVDDMSRFMVDQKLLDKPVSAAGMVSADYLPQK